MLTAYEVLGYLSFFIVFSGMGFLQWLLLKRSFSLAWYEWVVPTTVGVALGMYGLIWAAVQDHYIAFSPPGTPVLEWDPLLGGALLGLALGFFQGIVWWPRFNRLLQDVVATNSAPLLETLFPVAFAAVATGTALIWFSGGENGLDYRT